MLADVAECGSSQQRVADGVQQHVGIAMSEQPEAMGYQHSPEPQLAVGDKLVYIVAYSYAQDLKCYELMVGVALAGLRFTVSEMRTVLVRGFEEKLVVGTK